MNLTETNTYFTSDVHWGHKNIIKYSNRPYQSVEEMNKALIDNWNSVVKPNDYIFSLGDFSLMKIGHVIEILKQLNGNLYMILGNHDEEIQNNKQLLLDMGLVKEITSYKEIKINGQFICLFHYAMRTWNRSHRGSWQLFGHSHDSMPPFGKSVDVGVDARYVLNGITEYRPLSFIEIKKFMDKRVIETEDYHGSD